MRLSLVALSFMLTLNHVALFAQAPGRDSAWVPLEDQRSHIVGLSKDLMEIAESGHDSEIAVQLSTIASRAGESLLSVSDLLYLLDKITEPVNHINAGTLVRRRLQEKTTHLDHSTKSINTFIPLIKAPGVAQTALRLKDELRKGRDLLKATVVK